MKFSEVALGEFFQFSNIGTVYRKVELPSGEYAGVSGCRAISVSDNAIVTVVHGATIESPTIHKTMHIAVSRENETRLEQENLRLQKELEEAKSNCPHIVIQPWDAFFAVPYTSIIDDRLQFAEKDHAQDHARQLLSENTAKDIIVCRSINRLTRYN